MTLLIVTGALLVALLTAAALLDHHAKARRARMSADGPRLPGDVGSRLRGAAVHGDVRAYRGADGQGQRTGGGMNGV
ncbi:hypothetical protein [Modestobacter sp. KNN46-3]|jgi:hypothetical protein|uniref:hypothetical protein n=1 Tax=Modestobacter sp. KNN46-3 TaxID=2711218 RepID=UPI0013DEC65D|nr:hypothetical protein [Modestobacter sp. KNN46-3]